MKTLVVYYSLTGNTKLIAEKIAATTNADILAIKPKDELNPKGFMKYLKGGKQACMKKQPEILPLEKNPQDFEMLIIGTPVWASNFAPALRTFFTNNKLTNKKIALFCCHCGGKGNVFSKMKEALGDNQFIGEIDFCEPLKKETDTKVNQATEWAKKLLG